MKAVNRGIVVIAALSLLHHVDHVLRWDHSGWPFKASVTPFTFTLLLYPLLYWAFRSPSRRLKLRIVGLSYVAIQVTHIVVETPADQFRLWTGTSNEPWARGHTNILHIHSALLGWTSATLSLVLSAAFLTTLWLIWHAPRDETAAAALVQA